MQTLKLVADKNKPAKIQPPVDTEPGGSADKIACMLTYLRSLEKNAEQVHGDNDDWRYGRYLFYGAVIAALKKEDM